MTTAAAARAAAQARSRTSTVTRRIALVLLPSLLSTVNALLSPLLSSPPLPCFSSARGCCAAWDDKAEQGRAATYRPSCRRNGPRVGRLLPRNATGSPAVRVSPIGDSAEWMMGSLCPRGLVGDTPCVRSHGPLIRFRFLPRAPARVQYVRRAVSLHAHATGFRPGEAVHDEGQFRHLVRIFFVGYVCLCGSRDNTDAAVCNQVG